MASRPREKIRREKHRMVGSLISVHTGRRGRQIRRFHRYSSFSTFSSLSNLRPFQTSFTPRPFPLLRHQPSLRHGNPEPLTPPQPSLAIVVFFPFLTLFLLSPSLSPFPLPRHPKHALTFALAARRRHERSVYEEMDNDSAFSSLFSLLRASRITGERIAPSTMCTAGRPPSSDHGEAAILRRTAAVLVHVGRVDGTGRRTARTTAALHFMMANPRGPVSQEEAPRGCNSGVECLLRISLYFTVQTRTCKKSRVQFPAPPSQLLLFRRGAYFCSTDYFSPSQGFFLLRPCLDRLSRPSDGTGYPPRRSTSSTLDLPPPVANVHRCRSSKSTVASLFSSRSLPLPFLASIDLLVPSPSTQHVEHGSWVREATDSACKKGSYRRFF
jgi:hypothetical protein